MGRFCFSYGEHYDPVNLSFGRMLACNEFELEPGAGFGPHRHAGVDIVTTVLSGTLTHVTGEEQEVRPTGSYLLPAGPGVEHDERNDTDAPVRFVQAWFLPGTADPRPVPHVLEAGQTAGVAGSSFVLVTYGQVELEGTALAVGDSARLDESVELTGAGTSQALVWRV
ncbi:MAG TPA: pirin family protein [Mycobacteriales bacterium]|nr:pirin family protein [Mycobacteriales bacterium]